MVEKHPKIVGLGEILWDIYPDSQRPGGAPANAAAHAVRLHAHASIVSGVGRDESGNDLIRTADGWGIATEGIQKIEGYPTGTVGIRLDKKGIPAFKCSSDTAFDHMMWDKKADTIAHHADAVILGTLAQRHKDSRTFILQFLKAAKHALIVYDVNFRSWTQKVARIVKSTIELSNVLKVNEEELRMLRSLWPSESPDESYLMRLVDELGLVAAALTLGSRGCIVTDGDAVVQEPGISVPVMDTTGCGDAFTAVLTIGMLRGWPLGVTARCANGLAAYTATHEGAVPEGDAQAVVTFMNQHRIDWYF